MGVIFTGKNNTNFCIISYDSIIKFPFTIPLTCFCIIICFHDIEIDGSGFAPLLRLCRFWCPKSIRYRPHIPLEFVTIVIITRTYCT